MQKNFRKIQIGLIAGVMALCLGLTVRQSMAYFTDYTTAQGTAPVALKPADTQITEELNGLDKTIQIHNTGETEVFVKLRVFYPTLENLAVTMQEGAGWTYDEAEGSWMYTEALVPGAATTVFQIDVDETKAKALTQDFQIVVVHESVLALYDGDQPDLELSWAHGVREGE